jgi:uncharacterized phosphosugar-binding protein
MSVEYHGDTGISRDGAHLGTSAGAARAAPIMAMTTTVAVAKRMAESGVSTPVYESDRTGKGVDDD